MPIVVNEVSFEKSTKVKSLRAALSDFDDNEYDIALVLDADNMLQDDFLLKINDKFNNGCRAIQGRRVAKNKNTSFAILDGVSEHINNHIHRKGPSALGISANVIGSGMAFDFKLFKEVIGINQAVGGFDRQLQLNVVERKVKIEYLHEALIYDEKVDNASHFSAQRRRWISSQLYYLRKNFFRGVNSLFKGDLAYFRFSVLNNLIPPNLIYIASLIFIVGLSALLHNLVLISPILWLAILALTLTAFFAAAPKGLMSRQNLRALASLPMALFLMVRAILRIKGANKTFIHTPHTHVEIQK